MKTEQHNGTLSIRGIPELGVTSSGWFRDELGSWLDEDWETIEIDLSLTRFVDSSGLGALLSLHKAASSAKSAPTIRLLNPTPPVQQIFELTRMHHLFEIVKR